MPKNKVQEVIFTILMVFVMVYAMICYNIAVETGGMTNLVFLHAFRELLIMGPIAFLLDFFPGGRSGEEGGVPHRQPGKGQPLSPGSGDFSGVGAADVSVDEPGGNPAVQARRRADCRCLV